jgi:uncharacterized protein (DUF302 family)
MIRLILIIHKKIIMGYCFSTILKEDFETAIERVTVSLQTEGFGILTNADIKATFKKKLDVDFNPVATEIRQKLQNVIGRLS